MHSPLLRLLVFVAILSTFLLPTLAYDGRCSWNTWGGHDCEDALNNIHTEETYIDGDDFSYRGCHLQYLSNGNGDQPVSGQDVLNAAENIVYGCTYKEGWCGTRNCEGCHVVISPRWIKHIDPEPQDNQDIRGWSRHGVFHTYPSSYSSIPLPMSRPPPAAVTSFFKAWQTASSVPTWTTSVTPTSS